MPTKIQFSVTFFALFLIVPLLSCASIRERIKERVIDKQAKRPVPATLGFVETIKQAGDYPLSIRVGELTRYYRIHVPTRYQEGTPMPLLFVFHGGGGNMETQATDAFYKQISSSEREGFIAIFPNGISPFQSGALATWNAGRCCGHARDSNADDVEFVKQIIKQTQSQLTIDHTRIFATGMSNGGMMTYRLACEMSETFRAIAAVAGTDNTTTCEPKRPISILHIHARDDDHVLFEGGAGKDAFKDRKQITEFTSVPATIKKWRAVEGCTEAPKRILEKPGAFCEESICRAGARVQLCVTEAGGHSWPGGAKPRRGAGGTPSTAISANDIMWAFFNSL